MRVGRRDLPDLLRPVLPRENARAPLRSRSKPQPSAFGSPSLSPSPLRSKTSTPYPCRTSIRACFCVPFLPGNTITVAPFLDGTNQPLSLSPSLASNATAVYCAPRLPCAVSVRAIWVNPYESARGKRTKDPTSTLAVASSTRRV